MVGPPVFPSRSKEAFVLISKICPPFIVASSLSLLDPPAGLQRSRCCPIPAAQSLTLANLSEFLLSLSSSRSALGGTSVERLSPLLAQPQQAISYSIVATPSPL